MSKTSDNLIEEHDFKNSEPIKDEPKSFAESGYYEGGVKVRDLTDGEVEEIRLDHLQGDVDDQERNEE